MAPAQIIETSEGARRREAAEIDAMAGALVAPTRVLRWDEPTENDEQSVVAVPLEYLKVEPGDNHRMEQPEDDAALRALGESLKRQQLAPIGVMTLGPGKGWRLVWGFRRVAAAKLVGLPSLYAIQVNADVQSADAEELRLVENLNRADPNPYEQAAAVSALVQRCTAELRAKHADDRLDDYDVELLAMEVAARRVGRPRAWIADRAFLTRLASDVVPLVTSGKLTLDEAREIAKLDDRDAQVYIAKRAARSGDGTRGAGFAWVRNAVEREVRKLDGVTWNLAVPFANAPACNVCSKNSVTTPDLFASGEGAVCLDRRCFARKRSAANQKVQAAAQKMVDLVVSAKNKPKRSETPVGLNPVDPKTPPKLTEDGAVPFAPVMVKPKAVAVKARELMSARKDGAKESAKQRQTKGEEIAAARERDQAEEQRRALLAEQVKWGRSLAAKIAEGLKGKRDAMFALALLDWHPLYCEAFGNRYHSAKMVKARKIAQDPRLVALVKAACDGKVDLVVSAVRGVNVTPGLFGYDAHNCCMLPAIAKHLGIAFDPEPGITDEPAKAKEPKAAPKAAPAKAKAAAKAAAKGGNRKAAKGGGK